MRTFYKCICLLSFFIVSNGFAQTLVCKQELRAEIKYADINDNDTISVDEALVVFSRFLSNPSKDVEAELVQDVECAIIDLISYLEAINCGPLKKTKGSRRFIELYFTNKLKARA